MPSQDTITILSGNTLTGFDKTLPPTVSNTENLTRATIALTFQAKSGFFAGIGGELERADAGAQSRVHRRGSARATTTTGRCGSAITRACARMRRRRRRRRRPRRRRPRRRTI